MEQTSGPERTVPTGCAPGSREQVGVKPSVSGSLSALQEASDVVVNAANAEWRWCSSGGVAALVAVESGWREVDK